KNFIKTGQDLRAEELSAAQWPLRRPPYLFETSLPRVFAVGDVRSGSVKRVASAVGEGSVAVQLIHKVLAEELAACAASAGEFSVEPVDSRISTPFPEIE